MPVCSGETDLTEGIATQLTCEAVYAGNANPVLQWKRDSTVDLASTSDDDIGQAVQKLRLNVSAREDGAQYTCHMKYGNVSAVCHRRLNVSCKTTSKLFSASISC